MQEEQKRFLENRILELKTKILDLKLDHQSKKTIAKIRDLQDLLNFNVKLLEFLKKD